jgi:hypothetical protein
MEPDAYPPTVCDISMGSTTATSACKAVRRLLNAQTVLEVLDEARHYDVLNSRYPGSVGTLRLRSAESSEDSATQSQSFLVREKSSAIHHVGQSIFWKSFLYYTEA